MRLHLLAPPNSPVIKDCLDGFITAAFRFSAMMTRPGHYVILYGAEGSEATCSEFVQCISQAERTALIGNTPCQYVPIDSQNALWFLANQRMIKEVGLRKQRGDLLLTIGGFSQKPVGDAHKDTPIVEFSIGYPGSFAPYRVFESTSWRHHTYGDQKIGNGRFFDEVIPLFFDEDDFSVNETAGDYAVFVGRLTPRKGIGVACDAARRAGIPLKIIGHGDPKLITYGEYLGAVTAAERNRVMAGASAILCPTLYIEPFGATAVEAQMCGTPVVSTDFGAFTETVEQGVSGYRCHTFGEFVDALAKCRTLDRAAIARRAREKYSTRAIAPQYDRYFQRLALLWDQGWNSSQSFLP